MLDHIGFYVEDLKKSDSFYRPLFEVIGYKVILEMPNCIAYGMDGNPRFEIYTGKAASTGFHIAFHVGSKEMVENFYSAGLKLGAMDNGAPGYRDYFPGYYAAFLIDPNGHNLEAVYWDV